MIQVMIKRVWLCIVCLSLITVGCTGSNSNNREGNQDSQTNSLKDVVASNTDRENKLRDSPNERVRQRIEEIARTAQGRVGDPSWLAFPLEYP